MDRQQLRNEGWMLKAADDVGSLISRMAELFSRSAKLVEELDASSDVQLVTALLKTRVEVGDDELEALRSFNRLRALQPSLTDNGTPFMSTITALAAASQAVRSDAELIVKAGHRLDHSTIARLESFDRRTSKTEAARIEDDRIAGLESLVLKAAPLAVKAIESKVDALLEAIDRFRLDFMPEHPSEGFDAYVDDEGYDPAYAQIRRLASVALTALERHVGPLESFGEVRANTHEEAVKLAGDALKRFAAGSFAHRGGFAFQIEPPLMFATELTDALLYLATGVFDGSVNANLATRPPKALQAVELCAGAGGQAIGLMAAGFNHRALYEKNGKRARTLQRNWPNWRVCKMDVRKITDRNFRRFRNIDLIAGGPPCEPFSQAGKGGGRHSEDDLFPEMIRAVRIARPKSFMFETVPGILSNPHSAYLASIRADLTALGYRVDVVTLNAENFGLPQSRKRIVIVGLRDDIEGAFVPPLVDPPLKRYVADVLGPLVILHETPAALKDSIDPESEQGRYDRWAESWRAKHAESVLPTITKATSENRGDRLGSWSEYGFDVSAFALAAPTVAEACHPDFKPKLTLEMLACAQGFPAKWTFHAVGSGNTDMVGDAFPPIMAKAVGLMIYSALTGVRFDLMATLAEPLVDEYWIGWKPLLQRAPRFWPPREALDQAERYRRGEKIETVEPNRKRRKRIVELASQLDAEERERAEYDAAEFLHDFPDGLPA